MFVLVEDSAQAIMPAGKVLSGSTDQELEVIGDYLRRAIDVGRAQAERLTSPPTPGAAHTRC